MALEQRIETLRKRHTDMDLEIRLEESRPFPDTARLRQMKCRKLSLKDEIAFLAEGSKRAA